MLAGAIVVPTPAFAQEESPGAENEATVQAFGSFVKTTVGNGVDTMSVDPACAGPGAGALPCQRRSR